MSKDLDSINYEYNIGYVLKEFINFNLKNNCIRIITESISVHEVYVFSGDNYFVELDEVGLDEHSIEEHLIIYNKPIIDSYDGYLNYDKKVIGIEFSICPSKSKIVAIFDKTGGIIDIYSDDELSSTIENISEIREITLKIVNKTEITYISFINTLKYPYI